MSSSDPVALDEIDLAPEEAARRAGLVYVTDQEGGFRRKRWGGGFTYLDAEGEHVRDGALRERFERLVIPPAWTDVWICPSARGHILATGRDDAGRKQYIYHPDWEQVRNEAKFNRLIPFGRALPDIRARCAHDLRLEGMPLEKACAAVIRLTERTLIRIGNDEYADENASFGLSTMRDRHLRFEGETCTFEFTGKSGRQHAVHLDDAELTAIVRAFRDLPGYEVFQFFDAEGRKNDLKSGHVNAYLKETTGQDFSVKDFRTWGASVLAAETLAEKAGQAREDGREQDVLETIDRVAERLGNTRSVCRSYYVHPGVTNAYLAGEFLEPWQRHRSREAPPQLSEAEAALLGFLTERFQGEGDEA